MASTYNPLAFGRELHERRLKLGWSASQLCELYAEFVGREESPPGPTFIYHIESGTAAVSLERRAILASLVGVPLALVGIADLDSSAPLDVASHTQALDRYCDRIYRQQGTLQPEREAIAARANQLEKAVVQAFGAEKKQLSELLGFYQILLASTWMGQQPFLASALLSSTSRAAKEEDFSALHVHALTQRAGIAMGRFETNGNCDVLQVAMRDSHEAVEEQDKLPVLYKGLLYMRKGLLSAYTARDKQEFTAALHEISKGAASIGAAPDDKRIIARLDEERYLLTKASAYLHSPMGNAGLGLAQLQELEREHPCPRGKRRLVERNQLWTVAYLATGNYPMAAAHLEAAIENVSEDWIDHLIPLHTRLKNTSYGHNPDVGRLAVKIHQIKYPQLFR